jgi:hypothetical protein
MLASFGKRLHFYHHRNTPSKTQAALNHDDVAGCMIRTADYFVW